MTVSPIEEVIEDIKAGRMVILVDDEDRENEGDLVLAADFVSAEAINFMARFGRGLICLTLTGERCRQLNLPLMVSQNQSPYHTNFTLSIEAAEGVTTGISAADRATTVKAAVRAGARPQDIVYPGHIFPLMAQEGGVLARAGHTEAGCDIALLAGLTPASVICEILKDDGEMARLPDLLVFARDHGLKIGTIADLIRYRSQNERLVERRAERTVQTAYGSFRLYAYHDKTASDTHLALVHGTIDPERETWVRVHEPLSVMDFLELGTGGHSWSLGQAMQEIVQQESGVLILLRRPETEAELLQHIAGSELAPRAAERHALRNYGIGSQILKDLNVRRMRLMARPRKMPSMAGFDLQIKGYVMPGPDGLQYLEE